MNSTTMEARQTYTPAEIASAVELIELLAKIDARRKKTNDAHGASR